MPEPTRPRPTARRLDIQEAAESSLLTPDQVSELLGVPVATLYRWRLTGYGPRAIKVGKHLRWRRSTVDTWLADQENAG